MTKLNDIQLILLTNATQRENGSLLPAPATVADAGERLRMAISSLHKRGLVQEGPANLQETWRTDDDDRIGLFITNAGRSAINVEPDQPEAGDKSEVKAPTTQPPNPKRQTKSAAVIALLQRQQGATLAELVSATGWLPHTTRAALTGLRKKGLSLTKSKRGDETCYQIIAKH